MKDKINYVSLHNSNIIKDNTMYVGHRVATQNREESNQMNFDAYKDATIKFNHNDDSNLRNVANSVYSFKEQKTSEQVNNVGTHEENRLKKQILQLLKKLNDN